MILPKQTQTAQDFALWVALPMVQTSQIEGRLKMILNQTQSRRQATRRVFLAALGLAAVVLVPLATLRPAAQAQALTPEATRSGPDGATAQLKQLYHILTVYRARHNGAFPATNLPALLAELTAHPQEYGLPERGAGNARQALHLFTSPDSQFMDGGSKAYADKLIVYYLHNKRPDGTLVGTAKRAGTRDVFAYTNLYFRNHPHGATGFYLVLWDDGQVEKIPARRILTVRAYDVIGPAGASQAAARRGDKQIAFPGEAGLSWG